LTETKDRATPPSLAEIIRPAAVAAGLVAGTLLTFGAGDRPDDRRTDPIASKLERASEAFKARDCAAALSIWRELAERGNAEAQGLLGTVMTTGECGEADVTEALLWLRMAADSDDLLGTVNLAGVLLRGDGIVPDPVEAANLYHRAAAAGSASAQFALAAMYLEGRGVEPDPSRAASLAQSAAAAGSPAGQFLLGRMYLRGEGVDQDDVEAHRLFVAAAHAGHARAQRFLGMQYVHGRGVAADPVEAWAWFDIADRNGAAGAGARRDEVGVGLEPEDLDRARERAAEFSDFLAPEYRPLGER
jgi:TPR repeat protein